MKVYLTGETNGLKEFKKIDDFTKRHPELTKDDYLIILGDAIGESTDKDFSELIHQYQKLNCTILFIDGECDDYSYLNQLPIKEFMNGKVHYLDETVIHLIRGQIFDFDGNQIFCFGGANINEADKHFSQGEFNFHENAPSLKDLKEGLNCLKKVNNKIDYILTHDAPSSSFLYVPEKINITTKFLDKIDEIVVCKKWYFAHYHHDMDLKNNKTIIYQKFIRII